MNLPIDVTNGTATPPRFTWRQVVDTPVGKRVVDHEGMLPPNVEGAVAALVDITRRLAVENEELRAKAAPVVIPVKKGKG